ncbi:MAG: hypothetical protein LC127_18405 [Chitinophagales bacterium]|nr:hypothetical protein [Chitinophagales bacterium]
MKVVCIKHYKSQGLQLELTYGKVYDVLESNLGLPLNQWNYWIINDRGRKEYYSKTDFVELDRWRNLQVSKLVESKAD